MFLKLDPFHRRISPGFASAAKIHNHHLFCKRFVLKKKNQNLVVVMTPVNLWKPRQAVSPPLLVAVISQRLFVRTVENQSDSWGCLNLSLGSSTFINRFRASFSILLHRSSR